MDPLKGSIVFIVEDAAAVSAVFKEILERQHFQVIVMELATAAREYLEGCTHAPDVILLDLDLPDSKPDRTVELISKWSPYAPVIVISAVLTSEHRVLCERLGAHSQYEKADLVTPDVLISAVRSAITGHRLTRKMNQTCYTAGMFHGMVAALCMPRAEDRG